MVFLNKRLREYELSSSMIWVIRQWSIFCVVDIYTLVFQFPVYRNYTSVDPNSLISKFRLKRLIWSNTRRPPHQTTPTRIWWEPKGAKTTSEPKKAATPTNTKAARSKVALRTPTVNCLRKNNIYIYINTCLEWSTSHNSFFPTTAIVWTCGSGVLKGMERRAKFHTVFFFAFWGFYILRFHSMDQGIAATVWTCDSGWHGIV